MNIQEAFDAPRGFRKLDAFEGERGIPDGVMLDLAMRGHPVTRPVMPLGGAGHSVCAGWIVCRWHRPPERWRSTGLLISLVAVLQLGLPARKRELFGRHAIVG